MPLGRDRHHRRVVTHRTQHRPRHTVRTEVAPPVQRVGGVPAALLLGEHPSSLQLAGVATGCAANFAWRGHRRTRAEYQPDAATAGVLRERGMRWASDFAAAAAEVHALFRIREWGHDGADDCDGDR